MGKKKRNIEELQGVVAEFKVSMHCNACERTIARTISKLKGVEKFTTDMNKHKVRVTGRIDPEKVLKKLKKKTGKKVEIVVSSINDDEKEGNYGNVAVGDPWLFDRCNESGTQVLMMFTDENPNACSIM